MKKNAARILILCTVTLGLALSGCGSSGSSGLQASPAPTTQAHSTSLVYGVASFDTTTSGSSTVSAKDSSEPALEKTAAISSNGSYTVDVSGLNPPYLLKAELINNSGTVHMYSLSMTGGRTNINPISNAAVSAATNGTNPDDLYKTTDRDMHRRTAVDFESIIRKLQTVLAPLFALYQSSGNPVTDDEGSEDDNNGLRAMFRDVRIVVASGTVTVTNRQTGGVIFAGPLNDLASGTFHPENMPAGPGSNACTYTYSDWGACQSNTQTRTVVSSTPSGCSGMPVLTQACGPTACTSFTYNAWGACDATGHQTRTVATQSPAGCTRGTPVLSQTCGSTTCTSFTYNAWGACDATGHQTRTVATQSPAGCTGGTPVLSQTCGTPTCTSFTYNAWGACDATGHQTRTVATQSPAGCTGGTPVLSQTCGTPTCTSFTYNAWGACDATGHQTRTVATQSPAGCTGGTPVLSQTCGTPTCTSFTYNAWGACDATGHQTRTVATQSPAGCAGGTPVLSQTCGTPTCTSFTYNAWGACDATGHQTRTVATQSPAGCTGGTPALSQTCTPPPPPACGSCHAIPPSTGQHSFHVSTLGFSCSTCHGTGYSSTAVNAATHNNGVKDVVSTLNFNATARTCSPGCHTTRTW